MDAAVDLYVRKRQLWRHEKIKQEMESMFPEEIRNHVKDSFNDGIFDIHKIKSISVKLLTQQFLSGVNDTQEMAQFFAETVSGMFKFSLFLMLTFNGNVIVILQIYNCIYITFCRNCI